MEKGNKTIMIIIIALLVILLVAVGVLSFFAINTLNNLQSASPAEPTEKVSDRLSLSSLTEVAIEEKSINLREGDDGKAHVIRLRVAVNIDKSQKESEKFIEVAQGKMGVFEDVVNNVTRTFTAEEINAVGGWDVLKEELLVAMNEAFDTNLIYSVSIKGLIVQ